MNIFIKKQVILILPVSVICPCDLNVFNINSIHFRIKTPGNHAAQYNILAKTECLQRTSQLIYIHIVSIIIIIIYKLRDFLYEFTSLNCTHIILCLCTIGLLHSVLKSQQLKMLLNEQFITSVYEICPNRNT